LVAVFVLLAVVLPAVVLPAVPTVPPDAAGLTFVRMNAGVALADADVPDGDAVADADPPEALGALSIQPEKVTCLPDCGAELLGVCSTSPAVTVETMATTNPDRITLRIASFLLLF
jgi:hypothetical protein